MTTVNYALQVAEQMQSAGKLIQAQSILNSILSANPADAHALHLSGIIAYQQNDILSGIQLIQAAIKHNPSAALFHSNLGEMYRLVKDVASSIQCGQRAVALDANSATHLSNLGIAYYDAKLYEQAKSCHERALAIRPNLACSLNNMGSIYKTEGNLPQAITYYKAAIAAAPQFVEPVNNLGTILLEQQEYEQALAYFSQAHAIAPSFADVHCNMGLALTGLKHYDNALTHLTQALQLKPDYAEAYYGMAKVHLYKHNMDAALDYIHKAIALNSQRVEFLQLLADIHHEQNDHQLALQYLNQAIALDASMLSSYLSKGNVLMEMGETASAELEFEKITEHDSVDLQLLAQYCLAQLRKTTPDSPTLKRLLSLAHNIENITPAKHSYLHFALGKCFDDLGDSAQAFAHFKQGCNLKRKRITYDINEKIQFTRQLINHADHETLNHLRTFANPDAAPVFIIGMPRSGTTLVEQIIASHPDAHGAGELTYLMDLLTDLRYPDNLLSLQAADLHAFTEIYLTKLRRFSTTAKRITDKMPQNYVAAGVIHALFPNAKIIHVKRNAIDTCLSCYSKLFTNGHNYSYDLKELGQYYHCYERIMQHWRKLLPANAMLEINYEDIIQDFEAQAKRLIAYCQLDWRTECLAFHHSKRQIRTASFMQVRQPVYQSSVNRWRRFENELAPLIQTLQTPSSIDDHIRV